MPLPPKQTKQQRNEALMKAAETRAQRAEYKKKLKTGGISFEKALKDKNSDPIVGKMRVATFLASLPGIGKIRAEKLMQEVGIAQNRRMQGLSNRQTEGLISTLSETLSK